ncbi:MAG: rane protein of unknown function [Candidatus Saccharibacteria bacterium]|nr:rane protein of unknown function [Candidatus Saccharibacteria bacterium]
MFKQKVRRLVTLILALATLFVFGMPMVALAATNSNTKKPTATTSTSVQSTHQDITQAVVQSYSGDKSIQLGMLVKLDAADKTKSSVVLADQKGEGTILGVTVAPNDSVVTITPSDSTKQQIFVATTGRYDVLVSNQNGKIKAGDYVTISALSGIGMAADGSQTLVVGTATEDFSGTANVVGSVKLKDSTGATKSVSIGRINVSIGVMRNPLSTSQPSDYVPSFLSKSANAVANKSVSAARIYLGITVLFITALVAGIMLFSGVRSGMVSVGRNPLSKKSIIKSLIQTVLAGLIIFIVGVFGVYLLLKL